MKKTFLSLSAALLCSAMVWATPSTVSMQADAENALGMYVAEGEDEGGAEEGGEAEEPVVSPYFHFNASGTQLEITQNEENPDQYHIKTTGGDPYIQLSPMTAPLADDQYVVKYEYICPTGISGAEFFYSPIAGGREQLYDIPAASDWTTMYVNILSSRTAFGWGYATGDLFRMDFGTVADVEIDIRNIEIITWNQYCEENGISTEINIEKDEEGWYNLGSAEDLVEFSRVHALGLVPSAKVRLTADIDMASVENFQCIGRSAETYNKGANLSERGFSGEFDGQGYAIRNLTYTWTGNVGAEGLFGVNTGTIKNLGIDNFQFMDLNAGDGRYGILCGTNIGTISNCYVVNSTMIFQYICGAFAGGNYGGTIENCYEFNNTIENHSRAGHMVGDGYDDNKTRYGKIINCYSDNFVSGDGCPSGYAGTETGCQGHVDADRFASGEIAFLLNKGQSTPAWFQTIGEDGYPVLDNNHGYVVQNGDGYMCFTSESYAEAWTMVVDNEMLYLSDAVGQMSLLEEFENMLHTDEEITSFDDFLTLYNGVQEMKKDVVASVDAYSAYDAKIAEVKTYLEEHSNFSGATREMLEKYLGENVEPCDEFPCGSYPYIMETCELDKEGILAEAEFAQSLLDKAIASGYQPGANVNTLITNPYLTDGTNGWTIDGGLSVTSNETQNVGTSTGKTFNMSQTLSGLTPGFYELQVYAAYVANGSKLGYGQNSFVRLNGNGVYVPAAREGMIEYAEGSPYETVSDLVESEDGSEVLGFIPNSATGYGMAFADGKYLNTIVAEVGEDGELKMEINTPGCRTGNTTYVGNWALNFLGGLDTEFASDALDRALACQSERLQNLVDNYAASDYDYATSPNYYGGLNEQVQNAITEAGAATTNEAKYAALQTLSQISEEVYQTKQAYVDMMDKSEALNDIMASLSSDGLFTADDLQKAEAACALISDAYLDGSFTLKDALAVDPFDGIPGVPEIKDNVAQITTPLNLIIFSGLVNSGAYRELDAVLLNDLDLEGLTSFFSIGYTTEFYNKAAALSEIGYAGTFDGQGHVIKNVDCTWNGTNSAQGFFGTNTGTIQNLGLDNFEFIDLGATDGRYGILCGVNMGTIRNCYVVNSSISYAAGICGAVAGGNYGGLVENCYEFNNMVNNHSRSGHLVGDNRDDNSVRIGETANCYSDSYVTGAGRSGGYAGVETKCQGQIDARTFKGGMVAYLLNGETSEGNLTWYQTIGRDASPVFDNTHLVVRLSAKGNYVNFDDTNAEILALVEEAKTVAASTRAETGSALITSADQLSANCLWQAGYEIDKIIDNNQGTYFHSRIDTPLEGATEYLQVNLTAPIQAFNFEWYGRSDGAPEKMWHDTPDKYLIKATNTPGDETSWVEIGTFEYSLPNENGAYCKTEEPIKLNGAYTSIRFYVLHATSNNNYWNITEFQMYSAGNDESSVYDSDENVRAAVDAITELCKADEEKAYTGAGTKDDLTELQNAYKALCDLLGIQPTIATPDGTKKNPYPLETVSDLLAMGGKLKTDELVYFVLNNDIDLAEVENWTPLGVERYAWVDFDGQNHVIKNLTSKAEDGYAYPSFFGVLCGNVRNVGFENANIVGNGGCGVLGGYVGHSTFTINGEIQTCHVENVWATGKLSVSTNYGGGLAGNIGSPTVIKNCYVNMDIEGTTDLCAAVAGRVRATLNMENVYVAGSCNKCGVIGGGQNAETGAGTYKNIVVWNNLDQNFGPTAEGDVLEGISYYDGANFAELQQTVVGWGYPWFCGMEEGEYPTFNFEKAEYEPNYDKGLLVEVSQLSDNCEWNDPYDLDFSVAMLLDGDKISHFHSEASNQTTLSLLNEYIQMDLLEEQFAVQLYFAGRALGEYAPGKSTAISMVNTPKHIVIMATNNPTDEESWEQVAEFKDGFPGIVDGGEYYSPVMVFDRPYRYLRMVVKSSEQSDLYWNLSELQVYGCDEKGTAIQQIAQKNNVISSGIYDLQGRRYNDNQKLNSGLYIINGKKVMVK